MDPTLLQHPSQFDLPESKYHGQERLFPNPAFSTNDFSFSSRRPQNPLTSGTSGVALPPNPSLDFNGNPLVSSEPPYHQSSQLLLSPPDSTTGSTNTTSGNPTTSSNAATTLPRPFLNNACGTDHFSSAPISVLSSNWSGSSMTLMDQNRTRAPPLSPPNSYNSASGIGPAFKMPERLPHYSTNIQSHISPAPFTAGLRFPQTSYRGSEYYLPTNPYTAPAMTQDNQHCTVGDGPPFHETTVLHNVLTRHHHRLAPEISAHIQKGFFQVDRKWTCYRRNYFAVQCSFNFRTVGDPPFYLHRNGADEHISSFAVSISAKTSMTNNGECETRGLVQHTPKRDKASEQTPGKHLVAPTLTHPVSTNGTYSSAGHIYAGANNLHSITPHGHYGAPFDSGANPIPMSHTFERIQFQKATANNGKRRAQQQYFLVVVELSANVGRGKDDWVLIATKESDPMVVRGRSPGHYKDNIRRDSQTSMDPDCGTGSGSGGPTGSLSGPLNYPSQGMDWIGQGHSGNYNGSNYRHATHTRSSPNMVSPRVLTDAGTDTELSLSDSRTTKSSCTMSSDRSALTPLSEDSDECMFSSLDRGDRKRVFDDEEEDEHMRFPLPAPFTDSLAPFTSVSAMPYSKLVCASS